MAIGHWVFIDSNINLFNSNVKFRIEIEDFDIEALNGICATNILYNTDST